MDRFLMNQITHGNDSLLPCHLLFDVAHSGLFNMYRRYVR